MNPTVLYAAGGNGAGNTPGDGWIYQSTDGGATWRLADSLSYAVTQLALDPLLPPVVYALASDMAAKTADAGATWNSIALPVYIPFFGSIAVGSEYRRRRVRLFDKLGQRRIPGILLAVRGCFSQYGWRGKLATLNAYSRPTGLGRGPFHQPRHHLRRHERAQQQRRVDLDALDCAFWNSHGRRHGCRSPHPGLFMPPRPRPPVSKFPPIAGRPGAPPAGPTPIPPSRPSPPPPPRSTPPCRTPRPARLWSN